jgi:tetratricopeptide (TPR) repeat protein
MSQIVHEDPLESEIRRYREQLAACPTTHPERGNACHDLATSLYRSWTLTPSTALLEEAITLHREALALRPDGHPDHAATCNSLGLALRKHYEATGATPSLDEAIKLHQEAIALHPGEHPDRAASCNNLATALWLRYQVTGGSGLLDEIITLHREALALRPVGHPDRAQSCSNLAIALDDLYRVTGNSDLLDEMIILHREALALRPAGRPIRASSCNNLANALEERYELTGSSDLLDEIITLHREALALRPHAHPHRGHSCNNLANALLHRYQFTNSSDLLDEAITLEREALALTPSEHHYRAFLSSNLADTLHERYRVTGGSDLLDEAITLEREALALRPGEHPDRFQSCHNLANALRSRYQVTSSSDLLDEAIALQREGLALLPAGHVHRHDSCSDLASALQDRYQVTGSSDLLNEIIKLHREALALRPCGHPQRATSCNDLADSLWQRFTKTRDVAVVDEALALARENAASASSSELWRALLILFLIHVEQASPHFSMSTATEYLLQASASLPSTIPEYMRRIQSSLDRMWLMHTTWTFNTTLALLEVYSNIIDGLSKMTGFALDTISQLTALRSARSFGSDACVTALLSGHPHQAVELIDRAHGVIWAQALHQRDPQLQDIPRSLAAELEALFRAVSMPMAARQLARADHATNYLSPKDVRDQQNRRIQTLLTEVRAIPGLERFMLGRTYAQLRETAREHPVVVLVSARGYVYALIIRDSAQEDPDTLHLELTSDRLSLLRDTVASVGLRNADAAQDVSMQFERAMHISKRKETTALSTLADLWHDIVKPVVDRLRLQVRIGLLVVVTDLTLASQPATGRAKPRLHWCPTGDFALLPIHAAGIYDGRKDGRVCCSDYVVSSYTPTLSALLNAQNKAPQTAPGRLDILAIGEDARALPTMPRLFFVESELTTVEDTAKASKRDCSVDIIPHHATVEGVTARIQTAHFVHLACHGTQDQTSALNSGFHLSDKKLTISALMDLNLDKAWFAYLSACETAKSDAQQPDQVVHIASAMLHAGFKSVVATMW